MPHPDMSAHWEGGHPDEGLLHEWLDQQLPAEAASHIGLHVAACAVCAAVVAEARGLIAASRRILSALDDVPANVMPANVRPQQATATSTPPSIAFGAVASKANAPSAKRSASARWSRIGKIAAVLVVAVGTPFLLRDRSVTAPMQSESQPAVAASARGSGFGSMESSAPTPADVPGASALQAPIASSAVAKARAGVAADGAAMDAATADVTIANRALTERAPAKPARTAAANAAAIVATAAMADMTSATVAAELRADSTVPPRAPEMQKAAGILPGTDLAVRSANAASVASAAAGGAGTATTSATAREEARAVAPRSLAAAAPMTTPPPVGGGRGFADAAAGGARFDSITVLRTVCDSLCTATVLHIGAQGVVRYTIGTGNAQRVVRSQLSAPNRLRLGALLMEQFPTADDRRGFVSCASAAAAQATLQITLAFGAESRPLTTRRCAASPAEVRALGDTIDAIVNTNQLRSGGGH